jgi:predicted membrane-bound dolichyl-phosphate-mannose-protein mannosyltransferase
MKAKDLLIKKTILDFIESETDLPNVVPPIDYPVEIFEQEIEKIIELELLSLKDDYDEMVYFINTKKDTIYYETLKNIYDEYSLYCAKYEQEEYEEYKESEQEEFTFRNSYEYIDDETLKKYLNR